MTILVYFYFTFINGLFSRETMSAYRRGGRGVRGRASRHDPEDQERREMLKAVYADTCKQFGWRGFVAGVKMKFSEILDPDFGGLPVYEVVCKVSGIDTVTAAVAYVEYHGLNPLVLNMASDVKAGGGVRSGSSAQEEDIARRSDLVLTLDQPGYYPLNGDELIHSSCVRVIKDVDFKLLERPVEIGFVSCPALRKPRLSVDGDDYLCDDDREVMKAKIEAIFKLGLLKGYDSLILGAFGCGAFCNPPLVVAAIFKEVFSVYGRYFKRIGFAIKYREDDAWSRANFEVFRDAFADTA